MYLRKKKIVILDNNKERLCYSFNILGNILKLLIKINMINNYFNLIFLYNIHNVLYIKTDVRCLMLRKLLSNV